MDQDYPSVEDKGETNSKRATQDTRLSSTSRAQAKEDVSESFGHSDQAIWLHFNSPTKKKLVGIHTEVARLQETIDTSLLIEKISNKPSFKVNQVIKHQKTLLYHT